MKDLVVLAWRYVVYHRWKTAILVAAITLTVALPLAAHRVIRDYERRLSARAQSTPLLIGAKGSRFDLALHALYFRGKVPGALTMAESDLVLASGLAVPTPLYVRYTARGFPIAGTTLDYFDRRGLRARAGTLPAVLGDCVLGSDVARALSLGPGDRLLSDAENVFDLGGQYPLRMHVTGVLEPMGTADDGAVFVDLKTSWILDGIGHGHQDLTSETAADGAGDTSGDAARSASVVLSRTAENVVANAALPQYNEVTERNLATFHFHGDPEGFPITAVVAWPVDDRAATILRGRYLGADATAQALVPVEVVEELFGLVFRVKRFFDAQVGLVAASTILFLSLVVLLSLRLRAEERRTMHKIGCSRGTVFALHAIELGIVFAISAAIATGAAAVAIAQAPRVIQWMTS